MYKESPLSTIFGPGKICDNANFVLVGQWGPLAWQILPGSKLIFFHKICYSFFIPVICLSKNSKKCRWLVLALPGPTPAGPLPHRATPHLNLIYCLTQCGLYIYCDLFTNIFSAVFLCNVNFFRVSFFHCGLFPLLSLSWRIATLA